MFRSTGSRTWFALPMIIVLLATMLTLVPGTVRAEVNLRLGAGYAQPTGEIGDDLLGAGADFSLSALAAVSERGFVGAGIHLTAFSGQSINGVDTTESGGRVTIELLGLYHLTAMDGAVLPYVGGAIGYGAIGWEYSEAAAMFFGEDDDGIGFVSFTPFVGMDIPVNEKAGFYAEARFSFAGYEDETEKDFEWDLDGGHFFEALGGFRFSF